MWQLCQKHKRQNNLDVVVPIVYIYKRHSMFIYLYSCNILYLVSNSSKENKLLELFDMYYDFFLSVIFSQDKHWLKIENLGNSFFLWSIFSQTKHWLEITNSENVYNLLVSHEQSICGVVNAHYKWNQ